MPNYDTGAIRNLLTAVFPDADEIEFFCDDYFKEVKFEVDMALKRRAHVLTQYCAQNNQLEKLLDLVEKNFPAKYAELSATLLMEEAAPTPAASAVSQPATETQQAAIRTPEAATPADVPSMPPKSNDVFISYSRRDLAFVSQLHQELTKRGISAWFDKENIEVGDQWAASIVEGIRDCKVFVLALSPDSTASKNVRKEVDLAQRYDKRIVPLMWRNTEIPVAMEYQLAGIQWIDFKETASTENFNEMADVLHRLIGGASLTEATSDKPIAKESTIPAIPREEPVAAGPRQLGGLKKKQTLSPMAVGGSVISGVVTTFGLDTADQDFVNLELKWLFSAADNFLKIRRGEIDRNQPIATPIPDNAKKQPQANNKLLSTVEDFWLGLWETGVAGAIDRIGIKLRNLDILLKQEATMGPAGKGDIHLQNQIKSERVEIVKNLQQIAKHMDEAYGIYVTSPDQLAEFLQ